jgi:hypothetical protein
MTHIAVQESLNGKNVDWMEKVSDARVETFRFMSTRPKLLWLQLRHAE